tara:strand:+ start:8817 stop:9488 length:672 start_codon:yes stop_codon:yes gene_type:complete
MSELKELFNEIKSIFKTEGVEIENDSKEFADSTENNVEETTETVKEKFEDVVLADGTVAQIEPEVVVGAAVVVDMDGELLPAPDGRHELSDGRFITTESGVIVEVEEMEEEAEPEVEAESIEEEEMSSPLSEAQEREAKKIIESIVTEKVFGMEATLSEENNELKKEINNLKESFSMLLNLTDKMLKEPIKDEVIKRPSAFKALKKENKKDIISVLKSKKIIK